MQLRKFLFIGIVTMLGILTSHNTAAQDIETLVMPGEVIIGHADLESECSSCHKLFDKEGQRQLCLDCHEEVAGDVEQGHGFHGLRAEVQNEQCSSCHTEHEGRDAIVVILDEDIFDHRFTDFELEGTHAEAACEDCHTSGERHRETHSECVDCHRDVEPHQDRMGTQCVTCHQPTEWLDAEFDHGTTEYPLLGKHLETACLDCHEDRTFPEPPTTCFDCHAEDDTHNGRSGNDCANCHNPTDWNDSSFDHLRDTEFELLGRHSELSCGDCHSENPFEDTMDKNCTSCHLEDDEHDKHNGGQCDACHSSGGDWAQSFFSHDRDTDYKLLGGHLEVACNDCHVEPIFEVELTTTCESCHLDDDSHEGSLGTQCESCHTEVNWQDPVFFDHDLSPFPLLGIHADNDCEDCHKTQVFGNTESQCVSCHQDDDPHRGNFDDQCGACHNPVGWDKLTFDHNLQTDFALTGAHLEVACDDCHRSPLDKMKAGGKNCGSCHRASDLHDGEFGPDCGRCHSADSFSEVRLVQ
jgi:hypothetical protein